MEQYISKSALVAELEKIRAKWFGINNDFADGQKGALTDVLSLINTLEVKEVDLEKEIDDYMAKEWEGIEEDKHFYNMIKNDLSDIAKYFFELGLKAQKGE